jgi:hypothetical protein
METTFTDKDLAKLIKKCAFEWYCATGEKLDAGMRPVCIETCRGAGYESLGQVVYFLLQYTWNDSLDWADKILGQGYLAELHEGI